MSTPPRPAAARRLAGHGTTIFSTMSALAVRTGSLNLGQGFPDTDGPPSMIEVAVEALRAGRNQYAPGPGVPELRAAIARHHARFHSVSLDPDSQVLVTAGATEGIAAAVLGLVDPGDEVVVIEPYYDSYVAAVAMAGGVRRAVPLRRRGAAFRLDLEALRSAVHDGTRLLIVNTPHNPTGAMLEERERAAIAELAVRHDVVLLVDEVYEHLVYDGVRHVPLATLPGLADRTLSLGSAGKTFSVTGWKVGWVTGPADLVAAVLAAKQWLTYTNAAPLQPAVAHALDHELDHVAALALDLAVRRDLLVSGLRGVGLDPAHASGGYFTLTDVSTLGWEDSMAFCRALPERAGVVAIPAQVFYDDQDAGRHQVRWAFCKDHEVLERALERLAAADLTA